jgi:SAM-dependent methyltransferase
MAAYGRNNLNMNIVTGSLETFESDSQYDVISLIQVIGHFYDLDAALNNVYKLLKPGGLVLIESWNRSRLVARWFGKKWHEYSPPSVINWFSDTSISNLFAQHGFGFVAKGLPKKQINLKHAFTLIESKFPAFPGKQKIFTFFANQLGKFTVYYPSVDINWYLFRKPA